MPDHSEHEAFNMGMLFLSLLVYSFILGMTGLRFIIHYLVFIVVFLFATYFMSPDLDTDSKVLHRWRKLSIIWYAYRKMSKHRGISHKHFLGTLTKIIYLFLVFSFVWIIYLLIPDLPSASEWATYHWEYLLVALFAIILADSCHIYKDYMRTREVERNVL